MTTLCKCGQPTSYIGLNSIECQNPSCENWDGATINPTIKWTLPAGWTFYEPKREIVTDEEIIAYFRSRCP